MYFLAKCQLDHGRIEEAMATLLRLQSLRSNMTLGSPCFASGLLLLGEAYERAGDVPHAIQSYARLLESWRNGDPELRDRLEAERRLARLKEEHRDAARAEGPKRPAQSEDVTERRSARADVPVLASIAHAMTEIAIAFDVPTLDQALALDERLGAGTEYAKVGLQLFTTAGPEAVQELRRAGGACSSISSSTTFPTP